jgi:hypothetical protein
VTKRTRSDHSPTTSRQLANRGHRSSFRPSIMRLSSKTYGTLATRTEGSESRCRNSSLARQAVLESQSLVLATTSYALHSNMPLKVCVKAPCPLKSDLTKTRRARAGRYLMAHPQPSLSAGCARSSYAIYRYISIVWISFKHTYTRAGHDDAVATVTANKVHVCQFSLRTTSTSDTTHIPFLEVSLKY